MEKTVTKTAKSVEEAVELALAELGVEKDQAQVEVLEEGKGFLGLGKKEVTVKVTADVDDEASEVIDDEDDGDVYYGDDESFEGDEASEAEDAAVSFVAEVLSGIGIHGKLDSYREEDVIHITVNGQDCGAAIGRHGETLDSISYLTNLVANRHSEERLRVILDIGGYRKHREEVLVNMAHKAANMVLRNKRQFVMEPMNPAERRIVHAELQGVKGVTTHSEGEEPNRRVVVTLEG
ncbi:MAG: protein jag [Clostridiales bacterium]|nr:protein jag [Clostridiales bacterium]MBR4818897.1 protein jag [Clostridiales bacterium]MBR5040907.1 protein jag [Clostridiales bacterium]MBR5058331.1 protein jag [Clostridiales bacterium]